MKNKVAIHTTAYGRCIFEVVINYDVSGVRGLAIEISGSWPAFMNRTQIKKLTAWLSRALRDYADKPKVPNE